MAAPKALKSYNGTGRFILFIHPITFYSSPFFLDMSVQFIALAKIEHIIHTLSIVIIRSSEYNII